MQTNHKIENGMSRQNVTERKREHTLGKYRSNIFG